MPGRPMADSPRAARDGARPGGTADMAGPGRLVAAALAVGYRLGGRRSGRLAAVTGVAVLAVFFALQRHPTVDVRVAVLAAFAATAPFALLPRYPATVLAAVLSVQAGMLLFGRLSWTPVLVLAWLAALALCPLLLSRAVAVAAWPRWRSSSWPALSSMQGQTPPRGMPPLVRQLSQPSYGEPVRISGPGAAAARGSGPWRRGYAI
jgi:hypothetical protein